MARATASWLTPLVLLLAACSSSPAPESPPVVAAVDAGPSPAPSPDPTKGLPRVDDLAFVASNGEGSDGPLTRVRGVDPGGTMAGLRVELLDDAGEVVPFDGVASVDVRLPGEPAPGPFVATIQGSPSIAGVAAMVAVTPIDGFGRPTSRRIARLGALPARAPGAACDGDGFDTCGPAAACLASPLPAEPARRVCVDRALAWVGRYESAPRLVVTPRSAAQALLGRAEGPSLTDPPVGCVPEGRSGSAEALVRVHLPERVATLALGARGAAASIDTVISVLEGLDLEATPLACNDDGDEASAPAARVVLHDVGPGELIVLVDSLGAAPFAFELRAEATAR